MNNSPLHPNYHTTDYRFDPHMGFSEFLEEARQHVSPVNPERKKGKKSWKSKMVSWLKPGKKSSKVVKEGYGTENGAHISNTGRVNVYGSGRKCERPISVTTLFNLNRLDSYMCLDNNLNSPKSQSEHGVNAYGPVYLVT